MGDLIRQRVLVVCLNAVALGLLALHLFVRTLPASAGAIPTALEPESAWWGLWFITYLPGWVVLAGATLVVAAMLVALWIAMRPVPQQPSMLVTHWGWLLGVGALLVAAFFAFPVAHTRWGDAYMLANGIAWDDPALRITHSWQAPLDVFLHSQLWLALHARFNWQDATPAYHLLSPLAGAIYLFAALGFSLNHRVGAAWLPFALFASLGVMQLFFGYVENYSFAAAGVMLYVALAIQTLHGRTALWLTTTTLAITHAFHPSTIVLAPSLLVLGWLLWQQRNQFVAEDVSSEADDTQMAFALRRARAKQATAPAAVRLLLQIALPMLIVGIGIFVWMEWSGHGLQALLVTDRPGGDDGSWFVPLWEITTAREHYTMFSWLHVRDLLNEQLLVAPIVMPALLLLWLGGGRTQGRLRRGWRGEGALLLTAALCYLLFIIVWNPDYGGQRDWDLFSLAAIPLAALTAWVATRALTNERLLLAGMAPLLLLQALHTAAWVWSNTLPWSWPS